MTDTVRLNVAQAVVRSWRTSGASATGSGRSCSPGASASSATATSPGIGQALLQNEIADGEEHLLPYVLARNEQAMVHTSVAYARQKDRLHDVGPARPSVGPGSTNMLTGAALATINRLPVLLLPSGTFATRVSGPVLQELEQPSAADVTVNDAFRPRSSASSTGEPPEQLPAALARGHAGCSPTRSRPGRPPSPCPRTSRPRPSTGRSSCSPSGSGASPAAARAGRHHRRRPPSSGREAAPDRGRGAACTTPRGGGAAHALRADRHTGRREPGGQGLASRTATRRGDGAPSAPRAPPPPTRSAAEADLSSSASAPDGATSRPRREPPSRTRVSGSSTSTWPGSTRASTPASASSPTPARPSPPSPRPWRGMPWAGLPRAAGALWAELGRRGRGGLPPAGRGDRRPGRGQLTQGPGAGSSQRALRPGDVVLCAAGSMRATCTSCGGARTARPTTWSTDTPAWATRSPPRSESASPTRAGTSSRWSATAAT